MINSIIFYIFRKLVQAGASTLACMCFLMADNSFLLYIYAMCFVGMALCMEFLKPYGSTRDLKSQLTHVGLDSDDDISLVKQIKNNW